MSAGKKVQTKKIGSVTSRSEELRSLPRSERPKSPKVSQSAKEAIRELREARAETAAQAHTIRVG